MDTDVLSEARKAERANAGVRSFFRRAKEDDVPLFLSAITIGEMRQGVETIRSRGDGLQADAEIAQIWGRVRAPQQRSCLNPASACITI